MAKSVIIGFRTTIEEKEEMMEEARRRHISLTDLLGYAIGFGWQEALSEFPVKQNLDCEGEEMFNEIKGGDQNVE
jgi:hypothetical protein